MKQPNRRTDAVVVMLHSPLTFTGSQRSLSQQMQVQQHHINIPAGPSAAPAPALGTADAGPSRARLPGLRARAAAAERLCHKQHGCVQSCRATEAKPRRAPSSQTRHTPLLQQEHLLRVQKRAGTARFKATGLSTPCSTHDAIFKTAPLGQKNQTG